MDKLFVYLDKTLFQEKGDAKNLNAKKFKVCSFNQTNSTASHIVANMTQAIIYSVCKDSTFPDELLNLIES